MSHGESSGDVFRSGGDLVRIGDGELGGKAQGLAFFRVMLDAEFDAGEFPQIDVGVPACAVLATGVFDSFMEENDLHSLALSDAPDAKIAEGFRQARFPREAADRLASLIRSAPTPLAVRSSSLLEDAIFRPFAGVYETKMIPNNERDPADRLKKVVDAVKLVYASTYFSAAKGYLRASGKSPDEEKMACIVQEVVGARRSDRFYPDLSGVARSYNFYPASGARPQDGVVSLALGLGKTIVDGGIAWSYSPARPSAPPPYGTMAEQLKNSQTEFWSVNLNPPGEADPTSASEHLLKADLGTAEQDGSLALLSSTYDASRDRLVPGTPIRGPRVLNFAPLLALRALPLNDLVKRLLSICERAAGAEVEIEFALTLAQGTETRARLGFLQVRPMVVSHETVRIDDGELESPDVVLASHRAMGNGSQRNIRDVVFVKPETFEARFTRSIAAELEGINRALFDAGLPYLLIGFGRWGSSDPWLGIPVDWSQICGAKVLVEAAVPTMNVEPSQGSHFFHNLSSFRVSYLAVRRGSRPGIDWDWLASRDVVRETKFLRHVSLESPLRVKVDGRSGRGAIWRR